MTAMTDDTSLQPAVAAEYLALADVLASVSAGDWDTPCCARVGEYVR